MTFNFHTCITKALLQSSNIPSLHVYGVFVRQNICKILENIAKAPALSASLSVDKNFNLFTYIIDSYLNLVAADKLLCCLLTTLLLLYNSAHEPKANFKMGSHLSTRQETAKDTELQSKSQNLNAGVNQMQTTDGHHQSIGRKAAKNYSCS